MFFVPINIVFDFDFWRTPEYPDYSLPFAVFGAECYSKGTSLSAFSISFSGESTFSGITLSV